MGLDILLIAIVIGWNGKLNASNQNLLVATNNFKFNFSVWWSGAIVASTIFCIYSILLVWWQWRGEPIILTPDTQLERIGNIPFPAVSICPYTIASADKFNFTNVFRLIKKFDGPTTRNITHTEYVRHLIHVVSVKFKKFMSLIVNC